MKKDQTPTILSREQKIKQYKDVRPSQIFYHPSSINWFRRKFDENLIKKSIYSLFPNNCEPMLKPEEITPLTILLNWLSTYLQPKNKFKNTWINPKYFFSKSTYEKMLKLKEIFLQFDEDGSRKMEIDEMVTMFTTNHIEVKEDDLCSLFFKGKKFREQDINKLYLDFYQFMEFALSHKSDYDFRLFMRRTKEKIMKKKEEEKKLKENDKQNIDKKNNDMMYNKILYKYSTKMEEEELKNLEKNEPLFLPMNFNLILDYFINKGKERKSQKKILRAIKIMKSCLKPKLENSKKNKFTKTKVKNSEINSKNRSPNSPNTNSIPSKLISHQSMSSSSDDDDDKDKKIIEDEEEDLESDEDEDEDEEEEEEDEDEDEEEDDKNKNNKDKKLGKYLKEINAEKIMEEFNKLLKMSYTRSSIVERKIVKIPKRRAESTLKEIFNSNKGFKRMKSEINKDKNESVNKKPSNARINTETEQNKSNDFSSRCSKRRQTFQLKTTDIRFKGTKMSKFNNKGSNDNNNISSMNNKNGNKISNIEINNDNGSMCQSNKKSKEIKDSNNDNDSINFNFIDASNDSSNDSLSSSNNYQLSHNMLKSLKKIPSKVSNNINNLKTEGAHTYIKSNETNKNYTKMKSVFNRNVNINLTSNEKETSQKQKLDQTNTKPDDESKKPTLKIVNFEDGKEGNKLIFTNLIKQKLDNNYYKKLNSENYNKLHSIRLATEATKKQYFHDRNISQNVTNTYESRTLKTETSYLPRICKKSEQYDNKFYKLSIANRNKNFKSNIRELNNFLSPGRTNKNKFLF